MAEKLFTIISPNPDFTGFRNAGKALTVAFQKGRSAPVSEQKKNLFLIHFGKAGYTAVEFVEAETEKTPAPDGEGSGSGAKTKTKTDPKGK